MEKVKIGPIPVSRLILGSNPFSGFSHQGTEMDWQMKRHYTTETIKTTMHQASALGINTVIARTDYHIIRVLLEYWDQGGKLQWFAQTCPEVGDHNTCVNRAEKGGAKACHIHGGVMDHLLFHHRLDEVQPVVDMIRDKGMLAGIAGHDHRVFLWAEEYLDVDYYMTSYYNPLRRDQQPDHVSGQIETYLDEDRQTMLSVIKTLSHPAIHYKVMAAGRNDPAQALSVVADNLRTNDAVCVGVYTKELPNMLQQDVTLLEQYLKDN
jgi:hypothetical protein